MLIVVPHNLHITSEHDKRKNFLHDRHSHTSIQRIYLQYKTAVEEPIGHNHDFCSQSDSS